MKTNARLSHNIREETGIEEQVVEVDLQRVREVKGHTVADVEIENHDYLARLVGTWNGGREWYIDPLKHVY